MDFGHERKCHAVVLRAECLDLLGRARLLAGEIVGRHADDHQPLSLYFSYIASNPAYCGVLPHLEATLTSRTTLPE